MLLTKNISNLIKKINKYIKIRKSIYPLSSPPYQNWTDLGRSGGTGQRVLR